VIPRSAVDPLNGSPARTPLMTSPIEQRFHAALDALVAQIRDDRSILAVVLGGSLSHDTVWERSDIDLVLVTADDRKSGPSGYTLAADGVHVHAWLLPRAEFRRIVDGALHNSFIHAFLAKGRLLYTHDDTIADVMARVRDVGERDTQLQLLRAGIEALGPLDKAHKWLATRGDLHYTALWILYAATPIARVEVVGRRLVADREVIPQAARLDPALFDAIYTGLLDGTKTRASVQHALDRASGYVRERAPRLFAPIVEHLREVGEARSATELDDHFRRHLGVEHVSLACEYLAHEGLIGKASTPVRLTKRSNVDVQEMAFYSLAADSP
jgi:hypothetical protein